VERLRALVVQLRAVPSTGYTSSDQLRELTQAKAAAEERERVTRSELDAAMERVTTLTAVCNAGKAMEAMSRARNTEGLLQEGDMFSQRQQRKAAEGEIAKLTQELKGAMDKIAHETSLRRLSEKAKRAAEKAVDSAGSRSLERLLLLETEGHLRARAETYEAETRAKAWLSALGSFARMASLRSEKALERPTTTRGRSGS